VKGFFHLLSSRQFKELLLDFQPVGTEDVSLDSALCRVAAEDIHAPEDLPPFSRSTMDGFAVRARDCFGASESEPSLLSVIGDIRMGTVPEGLAIGPGQAARIWTGGMLPPGADAVVMLEYVREIAPGVIETFRAVAPGENVIEKGQDCQADALVVRAGSRLRPQELGVLAGLGITEVRVRKRPLVAIISTGDELVPIEQSPSPGKIRDINSTTLSALAQEDRCGVVRMGIVDDSLDHMLNACAQALDKGADVVLVSGGSSVGNRDFTLRVFESIAGCRVLAHGVAVRPGKPTLLARTGNRALFGLPGHVASAMVVYQVFVRYLLSVLQGTDPEKGSLRIMAQCAEPFPSATGREDYVRVALDRSAFETGGSGITCPAARPVHGKSGLISTLVKSDGLLVIPRDSEGLHRGEYAEVIIFQ